MFIKIGNIYFAAKKAKEGTAADFNYLKGCHVGVTFRCMTSEHRHGMNE